MVLYSLHAKSSRITRRPYKMWANSSRMGVLIKCKQNFNPRDTSRLLPCPPPTAADLEFIDKRLQLGHLPEKERPLYRDLIVKNHCVFSKSEFDLGTCKLGEHHIELKDPEQDVYVRQFPINLAACMEWLKNDVIEPSNSERYNTPMFVIPNAVLLRENSVFFGP